MPPITSVSTGQFILGCWAVFLIFWIIASFSVKQTVEVSRSSKQILFRMCIAIFAVLILGHFFSFTNLRLWPYSLTVGIIADIIAGCGLLLMLWSRVILGSNWSASVTFKQDHELIQRGPYAVVRHPIYSGLLLLFLGEAIWYGSASFFLVLVFVAIGFSLKAKDEEKLLTQHFPDAYPAYKARTKALIPFVW